MLIGSGTSVVVHRTFIVNLLRYIYRFTVKNQIYIQNLSIQRQTDIVLMESSIILIHLSLDGKYFFRFCT